MGKIVKIGKVLNHEDVSIEKKYWEHRFGLTYNIGKLDLNTKKVLDRFLKGINKGKILDNGCGNGRIKKYLEDNGWNTYGSDIAENAIKKASKISPLNLVVSPSENLPFRNRIFEVVLSYRVLHSMTKKNRMKALREMDRVLKDKGVLLISVQTADDIETIKEYKKYGVEVKDDKNSFIVDIEIDGKIIQRQKHFYTRKDLVDEIERNTHLEVVKIARVIEKAGWRDTSQAYWVVKAEKR